MITTDDVRHLISDATSYGDPLDAIERDFIEPAPLSDDAKSGLWLYAWSGAALRRGRRAATEHEKLLLRG